MKKYIIIFALITLLLSANAFAAPDNQPGDQSQPYVTSTGAIGTITADETGLQIVHDTFVMSQQAPATVHATRALATLASPVTARTMYVTSTGYNSEIGQTDDSPFITANGTHVRWGIVAANFLPFGTKIKIPDYYGDQIFEVTDRMNKRYWERVDVWFPEHSAAIQWGARKIKIEILGS